MQLFPKETTPEDERKQKLRELRSSMADRKGPAKTIEDVEMSLRANLVEPVEEHNFEAEEFAETEPEFHDEEMNFADEPTVGELNDEALSFQDEFEGEDAEMSATDDAVDDLSDGADETAEIAPEFSEETEEAAQFVPEPVLQELDDTDDEPPLAQIDDEEPQMKSAFNAAALISQLRARAAPEKPEVEAAPEVEETPAAPEPAEAAAPVEEVGEEIVEEAPVQSAASENISALLGSLMPQKPAEAEPPADVLAAEPQPTPSATEPEFSDAEDDALSSDEHIPANAEARDGIDFPHISAEPPAMEEPQVADPDNTPDFEGPISVPVFDEPVQAAIPEEPVASPRRGRAKKTRMLGFNPQADGPDLFAQKPAIAADTSVKFPVGWVIVIDGPGRGECFTLSGGAAQIGRGDDQGIRLDFGDTSISRENHAAIAYDADENTFVLAQGGKANLVRLNRRPVLSNETLTHGDDIKIGQTTLRFIALCEGEFSWGTDDKGAMS